MKIVVCIKQVPDTTEVRLDPKTNTLIREGVPSIINPDDKAGLEAALRLKEAGRDITVCAVSMGPPQAEMALREALAMGCDEAVLISGREFSGSDTYATATILAAAIKKLGFDLVIAGQQAIDGDTAQVGPQVAERLGVPQATYVQSLQLEQGAVLAERQFEDCHHLLRIPLPCLVTVLAELAVPRYMKVSGIQAAFEQEMRILRFDDLAGSFNPEWIGLAGSPTNVVKSFTRPPKAQGVVLNDLLPGEAAEAITEKLAALGVL